MKKKVICSDITSGINDYTVQRLLPTTALIHKFAMVLALTHNITEPFKNKELATQFIEDNWNYEVFFKFIRKEMTEVDEDGEFIHSKATDLESAPKRYQVKLKEYKKVFGSKSISNYLSGNNYESKLNGIRRNTSLTWDEREKQFIELSHHSMWIYELNQLRNDAIEAIILSRFGDIVMPTLKHIAGVDFYINGIAFDVKTSRSVGAVFVKDVTGKRGDLTTEDFTLAVKEAKKNIGLVSKSLFTNQSLSRFSDNELQNKLYVIMENRETFPTLTNITQSIHNLDLNKPNNIEAVINIHGKDSRFKFQSYELFI